MVFNYVDEAVLVVDNAAKLFFPSINKMKTGESIHEIDNKILKFKVIDMERKMKMTFSAGLARYRKNNISKTIIKADKKLYEAKENGRNQIKY